LNKHLKLFLENLTLRLEDILGGTAALFAIAYFFTGKWDVSLILGIVGAVFENTLASGFNVLNRHLWRKVKEDETNSK
jgi:uncharacterized membrane protein